MELHRGSCMELHDSLLQIWNQPGFSGGFCSDYCATMVAWHLPRSGRHSRFPDKERWTCFIPYWKPVAAGKSERLDTLEKYLAGQHGLGLFMELAEL